MSALFCLFLCFRSYSEKVELLFWTWTSPEIELHVLRQGSNKPKVFWPIDIAQ